jgi:hypothetical protein
MACLDFCDTTWNPVALDWAKNCIEPPAPPVLKSGAVWRRTWPAEASPRDDSGARTPGARQAGWFDSTQDLRDGLTVIELHAATPELALALAGLGFTPR